MKLNEFIDMARTNVPSGCFIAALTDELAVDTVTEIDKWNLGEKEEKVLEIRAFDQDKELKLFRSDIGREFAYRKVCDSEYAEDHRFTEVQILDIDEKAGRDENGFVRATGGGRYHLPLDNTKNACVEVCYYLDQDQKDKNSVHARVVDWRIVRFVEGK